MFRTAHVVTAIKVADQPSDILVSRHGSLALVNSFAATNPAMTIINTATNTVFATLAQKGPSMGLIIVH